MINHPFCRDCGVKLKTRHSIRCRPCSNRLLQKTLNRDWLPKEISMLKKLYVKQQVCRDIKEKLLKRHNGNAISTRASALGINHKIVVTQVTQR